MAQRRDSHSRVAVVSAGLRWARTGAVMSNPLLSRSSTPEYCQGDCTGKGQPALRRVAPRPHHSTPYVVSLRWTQDDDDDEQKVEVGQCAAVLTNGSLNAATHTSGVRKASRAGSQTACDQGRNVAEYLAVLPSRDARVIASARGESSVLDLRLED
jgi:hypothetical protein